MLSSTIWHRCDEKKKKKKKKLKTGTKTVKIIDDDIDLNNMRPIKDDELDICLDGEDAPQIAGIVDDRGPVDFTDKRKWKIINEDGDLTVINRGVDKEKRNQDDEINARRNESDDDSDLSLQRSKQSKNRNPSPQEQYKDDDLDLSPPRLKHSKEKKHKDSSLRKRAHDNDSDLSPPRHSKSKYADSKLHKRSKDDDSDLSPPRHSKNKYADSGSHKRSKDNDSDWSPPRKSKNYDSDLSPPRQSRNNDSDSSPPRRSTKHHSSTNNTSERSYRMSDNDNDSDLSSFRKGRQNLDTNLNKSRKNKDRDADSSRSRRKEHRSRRDNSPRSDSHRDDRSYDHRDRNSNKDDVSRSTRIKLEREYEDRDRKSRSYTNMKNERKKSRWDDETADFERGHAENHPKDHHGRMTKTLDGKKAGLQDAKASREETKALKRREREEFKMMEFTGEGQTPILRNKESGRKRNLEAEAAEKYEQEKRQRELNEQYDRWGKGLKQIKDHEERLQDDLYEMSKPLARYADDADLDKQLKEELKDGDPMLEYIKQKQIKEGKRKPDPPQYKGSYAPNRFGIKPGHRWDGVDRSNGYEKKWFETQNAKKARQEEAYKWSTADM